MTLDRGEVAGTSLRKCGGVPFSQILLLSSGPGGTGLGASLLSYVDRREVDFAIVEERQTAHFIECKSSGKKRSRSLSYMKARLSETPATLITPEKNVDFTDKDGVRVRSAGDLFSEFI